MDALFRILARIRAVDEATGVIGRISGAFSRLAGTVGVVSGAFMAFGGAKNAYDWTVKAAADLEMLKLGLSTVISANSNLDKSLAAGLSPIEQMSKKFDHAQVMAEGLGEKLQRASVFGIGTLNDYMNSALTIMPQLTAAMGQSFYTEAGQQQVAQMVNSLQLASSVLLAGRGGGAGQFALGARELSSIIAGTATKRMPLFTNMFPEWAHNVKEFNKMDLHKRFELVQQKLMEMNILSAKLTGTWSNLSSAAQEFVQYVGRGIGEPIKRMLVDLVTNIPIVSRLMNPATSKAAWDQVQTWATEIGIKIAARILYAADFLKERIIPAFAASKDYMVTGAKAIFVAALALKAASFGMGAHAFLFGAATGRRAGRGGLMGSAAMHSARWGLLGAGMGIMGGGAGLVTRGGIAMTTGGIMGKMGGAGMMAGGAGMMWLGRLMQMVALFGRLAATFTLVGLVVSAVIVAVSALRQAWVTATTQLHGGAQLVGFLRNQFAYLRSQLGGGGGASGGVIGLVQGLGKILWSVGQIIGAVLSPILLVLMGIFSLMVVGLNAVVWVFNQAVTAAGSLAEGVAGAFNRMSTWVIEQVNRFLNWIGLAQAQHAAMINQQAALNHGNGFVGPWSPAYMDEIARKKAAMGPHQMPARPNTNNSMTDYENYVRGLMKNKPGGGGGIGGAALDPKHHNVGGDGDDKKGKKKAHPRNVQIFNKGAIQIEIKNMNNYPPDRVAYDMKKVLMDKLNQKTQGTSGGIGFGAAFGGR